MLSSFLGPRVPAGGHRRAEFLLPTALLLLAALALLVALVQPVWRMTLYAPQYPKGLQVRAYVDRLTGDVEEIDRLNHYIGMRPLNDAAKLEREVGGWAIGGLALLLASAVFVHTKWVVLLTLPAFSFPFVFLADLHYWLRTFGTHLDPKAPLSSSIKPFVPPVLGEGWVGQFRTVALPDVGLWCALFASALIVVALYYHRRAFKPLVDRLEAAREEVPA